MRLEVKSPALDNGQTTSQAFGLGQVLTVLFKAFCCRRAVEFGDSFLTYKELHDRAMELAQILCCRRLKPESPIVILMPRGINHIVAQVAIIYCGGSCVPLDIKQPDRHLETLIKHLDATLVLTEKSDQLRLGRIEHLVVDYRTVPDCGKVGSSFAVNPLHAGACSHILHTSGTSGKPKAVQIRQEGILNLGLNDSFAPVSKGQRFAHVSNVSFDAAILEVWIGLLNGATLVVLPQNDVLDPLLLTRAIREKKIQVMFLTPALVTSTLATVPNAFAPLETLMSGGESSNMETLRTMYKFGAPSRFFNLYGPTESTVYSIAHELTPADLDSDRIPMGRQISGYEHFVVDEHLNSVPEGETGELLIYGAGVARCYYGEPELTARVFLKIPDLKPLKARGPNHFYRTGDLVRLNDNLEYEFVGRWDNQVKVQGHRVELEALERIIFDTQLVKEVAVLKVDVSSNDGASQAILLACVVPVSPSIKAIDIAQRYLEQAPHLLIPRFQLNNCLPVNSSGKIDRKLLVSRYLALLEQATQKADLSQINGLSAGVGVEKCLKLIWLEVLATPLDHIGPDDHFFRMGGTSIQAASLVTRIRTTLGIDLRSATLFENPTFKELTKVLQLLQAGSGCGEKGTVLLKMKADYLLGKELRPLPGAPIDWKYPSEGRAFLTGVTGFLGAFLLADLVRRPDVTEVACLVRAPNALAGLMRIRNNIKKYQITLFYERKLRILAGDFSLPQFGLSKSKYYFYARWASVIFHLGAHVNYVQPYSSHREANVIGTLRMLEFSNLERPKMVFYSSSISCYGPAGFVCDATEISEDERPSKYLDALAYDTGYSQSQNVAEMVVWNAIDNGFPAAIFRPGFVLGHSQTGVGNTDDFVGRLIASCVASGCYPLLSAQRKEFINVDFVINSILHLSSSCSTLGHAYNLIQPDPHHAIDMETTFQLIIKMRPDIPLCGVSYAQWLQSFSLNTNDPLHPLVPMLQEKVMGDRTRWEVQEKMAKYGTENLRNGLQNVSKLLRCPSMADLFKLYITHWLKERTAESRPPKRRREN
ncbi:non-ribosomal peptide synthetase [Penicillium sp. IBT 31633x]|nr:non-ribosomal peptide synthetase [Penicillium sp. IBT 31633x]